MRSAGAMGKLVVAEKFRQFPGIFMIWGAGGKRAPSRSGWQVGAEAGLVTKSNPSKIQMKSLPNLDRVEYDWEVRWLAIIGP